MSPSEVLERQLSLSALWVDESLHGPDCLWRASHEHEACSHEDACEVTPGAWHTCASPDHVDFPLGGSDDRQA